MPPLTDPERSRCFLNALANWRYDGYIVFAKDAVRGWGQNCPATPSRN